MKTLAALVFAVAASSASAFTGNDLHNLMVDNDSSAKLAITAYVRGFIDASGYSLYSYRLNKDGKAISARFFCMPAGATVGQAEDIVRNALAAQPANRHLDAGLIAFTSLRAAWPCAED